MTEKVAFPVLPDSLSTLKNWSIKLAYLSAVIDILIEDIETSIDTGGSLEIDTGWSISNNVTTKVFDPTATTQNEMAYVLATLIETLAQEKLPNV